MLMPKEEMMNSYLSQSSIAVWRCYRESCAFECAESAGTCMSVYYEGHSPDWAPWTRWSSDNTALLCAIGFVVFFNFKDNIRWTHIIGSFLSNEKIKQLRTYFNMLKVYWHYYDTVILIIVDITVWEILPNMLYLCTDIILKLINLLLIVPLFSFITCVLSLQPYIKVQCRYHGTVMVSFGNTMVLQNRVFP